MNKMNFTPPLLIDQKRNFRRGAAAILLTQAAGLATAVAAGISRFW